MPSPAAEPQPTMSEGTAAAAPYCTAVALTELPAAFVSFQWQ